MYVPFTLKRKSFALTDALDYRNFSPSSHPSTKSDPSIYALPSYDVSNKPRRMASSAEMPSSAKRCSTNARVTDLRKS